MNLSKRGARTTFGIPGTGISYAATLRSSPSAVSQNPTTSPLLPEETPHHVHRNLGSESLRSTLGVILLLVMMVVITALTAR